MTQQLHPTIFADHAQSVADRWAAAVARLAQANPSIAADCLRTMERIAGNVELYTIEAITSHDQAEPESIL